MNLKKWLSDKKITEVECLVSDIAGIPRGKIVPVEKYINSSLSDALRLPEYVFGQNVTGEYGDSRVLGETVGDVVLKPDVNTVRLVPWYKEPTAQIIHDAFYFDGKPVDVSPREVLNNVLRLFKKKGLKPVVAPELEFFLVEQNSNSDDPLRTPLGRSGLPEKAKQAYGIDAVNDFDPLFEDVYDYCEIQKIDIDTLSHEAGAAQMEINFNHGDAIELADQVFLFKRTVRQTAITHNLHATFMAKPMQFQPGSAMHIHSSIIDQKTGKNIFSNKNGSESQSFYYAIAGLQNHFSGAMALVAPYVNSYRRPPKNDDAPANLGWGIDNRTVGLRVPVSSPTSRRIENRIPGADSNPYLAIAATLACIWLGLEEEKMPKKPKLKSLEGVATLPRNLDIALDMLEKSDAMHKTLGERFVKLFAEVKRTEAEAFLDVISPWERQYLLLNV